MFRGLSNSICVPSRICGEIQKAIDDAAGFAYFPCVANAPKNSAVPGKETMPTMPFEEALKKLEGLVEAMESGDLPLESLLDKYEEGSRLVKICQAKLEEAELKIQKLEKTGSGEFVLKPADAGPIQGKTDNVVE